MTAALFLSIAGIAFLDSLNPSLFVAQFYLLTTARPIPRIMSYIAGILLVNFTGGVLILGGARVLIAQVLEGMSGGVLHGAQLALGVAILLFGVLMKTGSGQAVEAAKPRSLRPIHTFALGMVVMLNEITTALPYFVAIEQISQANLSVISNLLILAFYNLVFSLPLFGFLLLSMIYRERFAVQIAQISRWLGVWMPRLIKWVSIAFGVWLAVDAVLYFTAGVG